MMAQIGRKVSCYNVKKRFSVDGGPYMLGSCKLPKIRKFFMKAITITPKLHYFMMFLGIFVFYCLLSWKDDSRVLTSDSIICIFLVSLIKFNLICIF